MAAFHVRLAASVGKVFSASRIHGIVPIDHAFPSADVSKLHQITAAPESACVDDQTWTDLLLDDYSARLSPQVSIFGRQILHQRLRNGLGDDDCAALVQRLRTLMDDPVRLQAQRGACESLRHADTEVAELLFARSDIAIPSWAGRAWLLTAVLTATVAAAAWTPVA